MKLKLKEGTGNTLLKLEVLPNTTIAEVVSAVNAKLNYPIDKINLLLSNDLPLDIDKSLSDYKNPSEVFVATQIWYSYFSEDHQKHYYFDPLTENTLWELPEWAKAVSGLQEDDLELLSCVKPQPKQAKYSHFIKPSEWLEGKNYLQRPARKQLEKSYEKEYSYKQGDDEYNIWHDKYINDNPVRTRTPAATRCDPDQDIGYTKADHYDPHTAYWCLHFVRGCCTEGANCRFFHHMPSFKDCQRIPLLKDIFGRTRHSEHRQDMAGIGCFQKECKTLCVVDIKLPPVEDPIKQVNEMLWKHFSLWGRVEDVLFIPSKTQAFVKYYHRCYAEIAKEAMTNQALDFDEMLGIKWANDDPDPSRESQFSEAWHKAQIHKERQTKAKTKQPKQKKTHDYQLPKKLPPPVDVTELETQTEENTKAKQESDRMQQLLDRIQREQPDVLPEIIFPANLFDNK